MNMGANDKEVEDHQLYEDQEYDNGDPIQGVIYNDVKHAQIEEFLQNGDKNEDSCDLSISKGLSMR